MTNPPPPGDMGGQNPPRTNPPPQAQWNNPPKPLEPHPNGGYYPPAGAGYYYFPGSGVPNDRTAVISLVLSVLGFMTCLTPLGVLGLVLGYSSRRKIRESGGSLGGEGLATAGIVIGWITAALTIVAIGVVVAIMASRGF